MHSIRSRTIASRTLAITVIGLVAAPVPTITTVTTATAAAAAAASDYHRMQGTAGGDRLVGSVGSDLVAARAGNDTIRPRSGADIVRAAGGDDRIFLFNDGDVDRIHCGRGFDLVAYHFSVDQRDIIDANCEGRIA